MVLALNYRRPRYVDSKRSSSPSSSRAESVDSKGSTPYGVPEALSFDRIIAGGTCPVSFRPHDRCKILTSISHARSASS